MTDIGENLINLWSQIPESVKLIAVSKTKPVSDIQNAYNFGQRRFGENKVQELLSKKDQLPRDIEWHLIGHLQSNKVKSVVPFISMIHSIDSFKLLTEINAEAHKISRIVNCLLQIHIADEQTKYGFSMDLLFKTLQNENVSLLKNVRICGVMGMATYTTDRVQVTREFHYLRECFDELKCNHFITANHFKEISMGMSGDYELAVREGSTMVRIGSLIFGERNSRTAE
jgi:hypothetical protein